MPALKVAGVGLQGLSTMFIFAQETGQSESNLVPLYQFLWGKSWASAFLYTIINTIAHFCYSSAH